MSRLFIESPDLKFSRNCENMFMERFRRRSK